MICKLSIKKQQQKIWWTFLDAFQWYKSDLKNSELQLKTLFKGKNDAQFERCFFKKQ